MTCLVTSFLDSQYTHLFRFIRRLQVLHHVSLGPVDPSFRALSGNLKFMVRRHKSNTDSLLTKGIQTPMARGRYTKNIGGPGPVGCQ